jgi:hypothetical protein
VTRAPVEVSSDIDVTDAGLRGPAAGAHSGAETAPASSRLSVLHARAERLLARLRVFQTRAPRLIGFLRLVYYPLALALVAYIAVDAFSKINIDTIRWWPLAGSYFAALCWWLCLAFGWSMLVTEGIRLRQVSAWCRTQVARYLPGGIWAPIARATTVDGRVRDKVAAVGAENVVVLCAALAVGGLWTSVHNPVWLPLVAVAIVPLALAGWLARRTRVTRAGVIRALIAYAIGFFCYGLSGIWAQLAVSGLHRPTYPLYIAGASCLSWAVGLVVVFAPGGVGVREVVYVWMLSGLTYTQTDLRAAAITSRLASVLAELTVLTVVSLPAVRRSGPDEIAPGVADDVNADVAVEREMS